MKLHCIGREVFKHKARTHSNSNSWHLRHALTHRDRDKMAISSEVSRMTMWHYKGSGSVLEYRGDKPLPATLLNHLTDADLRVK